MLPPTGTHTHRRERLTVALPLLAADQWTSGPVDTDRDRQVHAVLARERVSTGATHAGVGGRWGARLKLCGYWLLGLVVVLVTDERTREESERETREEK